MKKLIVILSLMIMPMIVYGSSTGANRTYDVAVATFVGNNTVGSDQIINDSINPAVDIGAGIMATDVVASSVAVNVINNKHIIGCVLDTDVIVSSISATATIDAGQMSAGYLTSTVIVSSVTIDAINNKHIRGCVLDSDVIVSSITIGKVTRGTILADAIDSTKIGATTLDTDVCVSSMTIDKINNKHIVGCVLDADVIVSSISANKVTRATILNDAIDNTKIGACILDIDVVISSIGIGAITPIIMSGVEVDSVCVNAITNKTIVADAIDSTKIGATTLDADVVVSSITINKVGTNQIINDGVSPVNDIGAGILANDVIVSSVGVGAITKAIMTGVEVSSFPMKPFACVHVDTNSVITCGSNALFYICKGTWTGAYELDEGRMFTVSNGTITYTGATKHYFNIVCAMTISGTTNGVRPLFIFYLNGVPYVKGEQHTVLGTANDEKMIVMNCLEDLSTNETVSLYVRCEVNGDKVEIHHSAITIFQVD